MSKAFEHIRDAIEKAAAGRDRFLVAIDGRCASGKSTLGRYLVRQLPAGMVLMDDFFLRPSQRTPERYAQPGGNVDRERVRAEVIDPFLHGDPISYQPFDCSRMELADRISVPAAPILILEGSYSLHPYLRDAYDLKIFLSVSPEEQQRRLLLREGPSRLKDFNERWIPLEERYFEAMNPAACADIVLDTSEVQNEDTEFEL